MLNKRRWVTVWLLPGLFLLFFPDVVTAKKEKNVVVLTRIMDMADSGFRKARLGWVEHARFSQGVSRKPNKISGVAALRSLRHGPPLAEHG
jgi:hypothetical protein